MTPFRRQLIISGVGGQGVLFVTRLLAEAALEKGLPVLTAETHGMAQRGGTVLSHLKLGSFDSPLIRPATADGLLVLKGENFEAHRAYLHGEGWAVINRPDGPAASASGPVVHAVDADALAGRIGRPQAANLVLLGYALAALEGGFFCTLGEMQTILHTRLGLAGEKLEGAAAALQAGSDRYTTTTRDA
jgi:indolepyruvate ferredoxin oxidoreductase beta subunit